MYRKATTYGAHLITYYFNTDRANGNVCVK